MNSDSIKLMAAALYEIRCQLGTYLGSTNQSDAAIRLSAHLAYILHNEAMAIIDGIPGQDVDMLRKNIICAEKMIDSKYADAYGILKNQGISLHKRI